MQTLSRASLAIFISTLFGACANVGVVRLGEPVAARPEHCQLQVFAGAGEVTREYTSVCMLDSHSGENVAEAVDASREAACTCGADAIIIEQGDVTTEYTSRPYAGGPYADYTWGRGPYARGAWGPGPFAPGPWGAGFGGFDARERGHATVRAIKFKP